MSECAIEFRLTLTEVNGIPAFDITDAENTNSVKIALIGATLLSWRVDLGDGPLELVDGYADREELDRQAGVRSGTMAPFTNRLRDSRYSFQGNAHDLSDAATGDPPALLHGLLRDRRFAPVESIATDESFMVRLRNHELGSEAFPGYPFLVGVDVVYVVRRASIDIEIVPTNFGDDPAPFCSGWHPYFTLGSPVDDLVLTVPAHTRVQTDESLIPLDGGESLVTMDGNDDLDFRAPQAIGSRVIDALYTNLDESPGGGHRALVSNPKNGITLEIRQERGSLHVYTGDHLERGRRQSLALEPVEAMANAFNRPDHEQQITLSPGQVRPFRFGVTVSKKQTDEG